jgi:peptidoglycan-N-acetylglucosamine deacetylase
MDPDSGAEQAASKIIQTAIVSVFISACHYHEPELKKTISSSNIRFATPDTTAKVVKAELPKKKKKKTIYLTFDDGPNKGTRKVMNIVEEEKVPVTMFMIGEQVYGSHEQNMVYDSVQHCSYIEIANHSYTHAHSRYQLFYTAPDSVVKDFMRCEDSLQLSNKIVRTPGRNIWRTANINSTDLKKSKDAADSLQQKGFTVVGWDLEWHYNNKLELEATEDYMLEQIDSMFARNKTKTADHLVLLAHDQVYADTCDSKSLQSFIQKLKNKEEYDFEVISQYPELRGE